MYVIVLEHNSNAFYTYKIVIQAWVWVDRSPQGPRGSEDFQQRNFDVLYLMLKFDDILSDTGTALSK